MSRRLALVAAMVLALAATPAQAHVPRATGSPATRALAGFTIVLDPGHNSGNASDMTAIGRQVWAGTLWKDCDTVGASTDSGYNEAAHNFDVALRIRRILRLQGARVVLTRWNDDGVGPCITQRAAVGNRVHADAAVSIHADGNLENAYHGFHVILPADEGQGARMLTASQRLGYAIRDALRLQGPTVESNYIGRHGLIVRDDLGGLNLSQVPKVFTEIGNMHSTFDAPAIESPEGRQQEAAAIAAGIARFLTSRRV